MASFPENACIRCGGVSQFQTRTSLPPQAVYRCMTCGYNTWVPLRGDHTMPPPGATSTGAVMQLQQQPAANLGHPAPKDAALKPTDDA